MSLPSKATFVLVPGSFATIETYDVLTPHIAKAGYEYKLVPLLSANKEKRLPAPSMHDDAAAIRTAVLEVLDAGKNVVLVVHSYSGIPGTESLKGLGRADRGTEAPAVIGIVYVAAHLPVVGESVRSVMAEYMPPDILAGTPGGYLSFPVEYGPYVFNDIEDAAEVERWIGTMVNHSSDTYSGKLTYAAWMDIPSIYLSNGKDMTIPLPVQTKILEQAEREGGKVTTVFWEDSGHCPTISRPELVAEQLFKAASF